MASLLPGPHSRKVKLTLSCLGGHLQIHGDIEPSPVVLGEQASMEKTTQRFQKIATTLSLSLSLSLSLVARVSTGSAVQQQCSSAAVQQIRVGAVPDAILPGHRRAPSGSRQGHPQHTGA